MVFHSTPSNLQSFLVLKCMSIVLIEAEYFLWSTKIDRIELVLIFDKSNKKN